MMTWRQAPSAIASALVALLATGCATNRYEPPKPRDTVRGMASWYGKDFHGKPTANGETYDMYGISAAHRELPLGTVVDVTHLDNGRQIRVRINDRGPFIKRPHPRPLLRRRQGSSTW